MLSFIVRTIRSFEEKLSLNLELFCLFSGKSGGFEMIFDRSLSLFLQKADSLFSFPVCTSPYDKKKQNKISPVSTIIPVVYV
jgi:hypothetical protein